MTPLGQMQLPRGTREECPYILAPFRVSFCLAYVLPRTQTKSALSEQLRPRRVPQSTKSQLQVLC